MSKRWTVVVPTIREQQLKEFILSFKDLFEKHVEHLFIIEDNPKKTFSTPEIKGVTVEHYAWNNIDRYLGKDAWIIPRRSDCIRSFGFLAAYQTTNSDYILTLDDDVRYNGVDIFAHYEFGFNSVLQNGAFFDTMQLPKDISPRGFPFSQRKSVPVMLQWGMWEGVPDLDGVTQLQHPITDYKVPEAWKNRLHCISKGLGVTGCIMNCAFRREVIPAMYQLLMGKELTFEIDLAGERLLEDLPYDRWGDIWSGHIAKKYVEDVLNGAVAINYAATVRHERASNVYTNIKKELSGYEVNEVFWDSIREANFSSYKQIADYIRWHALFGVAHSDRYEEAMKTWDRILKQ